MVFDIEFRVGAEGGDSGVVVEESVGDEVGWGAVENASKFDSVAGGVDAQVGSRFLKIGILSEFLESGLSVLGVVFLEEVTLPVFDFEDRLKGNFDSLIGQSAKSRGHVEHGDFSSAQGE